MPIIEIDHGKLYFALSGRGGRDILLVHGSGGDHTIWSYQVRGLRERFSVAALALNGHGRSAFREGEGLETYTQDVLAVLERLSPDTFLVGHSLGGAVVLNVALRYPQMISGIGLIGTGARLRVLPEILELVERDFRAAIDLILSWAFAKSPQPELLTKAKEQMQKNGQRALLRDLLTCDSFDVLRELEQIGAPALIVCGREDRLTPVKYAEYLRDHIPDATLKVIEGAGHMVMLERPEELNRAIEDFLNTGGDKEAST
ncbi:MAG: alpha/beta fold hydrolase [Candidatus Bipolaricaulia bacterium]